MIDCFRQVIKNKGVMALWSGLTANMVKVRFVLCVHVMAEIKITSALYVFYVNVLRFDFGSVCQL